MKHIEFDITDDEYLTISDLAHRRGATVTDVLRGAAAATAREYGRPIAKLVAELHAQDLTTPQIATELGVTVNRIRPVLHTLGLSSNRAKPTPKPFNPRARRKV